jgi:hypothetical protein
LSKLSASKPSALLYPVRDAYIARFEAFLRELRGRTRSFIVEPEMRDSGGGVSRRGALGTITRHDVIGRMPYGSIKAFAVDSDRLVEFPRARFDEDGVDLGVSPFLWENMQVWADGPSDAVCRALSLWFGAAATPAAGCSHQEIQGVAHFISDPIIEGEFTTCVIDLGSAPVEAVMALLGYLWRAGARRVDLGELQT